MGRGDWSWELGAGKLAELLWNIAQGLRRAVIDNDLPLVESLLSLDAWSDSIDEEGYTPLHLAAAKGHREVVVALLRAAAPFDAATHEVRNPRHSL